MYMWSGLVWTLVTGHWSLVTDFSNSIRRISKQTSIKKEGRKEARKGVGMNMAFLSPNNNVVFPNTNFICFFPAFSNFPKHRNPLLPHHPYRPITISAAVNTISAVQPHHATTTSTLAWSEFGQNVSGEWDGYGADFTKDGKPVELPEYVVPEAFREWEVKVFDWQTQCPTTTTTTPDADPLLISKLIKLLPTVGCEADAATRYSVDERNLDHKVSAFAYHSSGCYVAVWPTTAATDNTLQLLELEHCLVDPRNKESRVRIILFLQPVIVNGCNKFVLRNIQVFCEQWYGPFRNGEQLGGCAIRDSAFASTDALKGSQVTGAWQARNSIARFPIPPPPPPHTNLIEELVDDGMQNFVREEGDLIFLPKQLWCSLKETEDGGTGSEVGWLFDQGHAITSRCIFSSDSKLKEIALACESAALDGL